MLKTNEDPFSFPDNIFLFRLIATTWSLSKRLLSPDAVVQVTSTRFVDVVCLRLIKSLRERFKSCSIKTAGKLPDDVVAHRNRCVSFREVLRYLLQSKRKLVLFSPRGKITELSVESGDLVVGRNRCKTWRFKKVDFILLIHHVTPSTEKIENREFLR